MAEVTQSGAPLSDSEIDARIRKCRTAEVTLTVTDAAGRPLAGQAVTVRQARHKFLFGCNAFRINTADSSDAQKAYQKQFADLFNLAVLPFYLGGYEPTRGDVKAARLHMMAEWCRANHIQTKGHPLCWQEGLPKWLEGKPAEEVGAVIRGRIERDVKEFAGIIDRWDVVNEAVRMPDYEPEINPIAQWCRKVGRVPLIQETFAAARKAGPKAVLILNDYVTIEPYVALIRDCLAAGVPMDVIGIQSHQHAGYWGAEKAWTVCGRFAQFGKPIHFTEATILSGEARKDINYKKRYDDWPTTPEGERRQAEQVTEFYRVLFSHPAVEAITWWDFDDGNWLGAPAGLVRRDMSAKPAYEALMGLVKKAWWTGLLELKADKDGKVKFRGYLGEYVVESAGGWGTVEVPAAGEAAVSVALAPGRG